MPHYFFNIVDGAGSAIDPDGTELPDIEAARREAVLSVKDIVGDELRSGGMPDAHRRIEVADERGHVVLTLSFADAINEQS